MPTAYFNPRSREGSDGGMAISFLSSTLFQSTLPRGERRWLKQKGKSISHFNPRSREGSDTFSGNVVNVELTFQSTLPRGERPGSCSGSTKAVDFNPRSREGSDNFAAAGNGVVVLISIHAPARGATPDPSTGVILSIFQSTLPRGERRHNHFSIFQRHDFNPRSREGSDSADADSSARTDRFQSTLPRGERPDTTSI